VRSVAQQHRQTIREQIARRAVASRIERRGEREQLTLGKALAVLLYGEQRREQIVARIAASRGEQLAQVGVHLRGRSHGVVALGWIEPR